MFTVVNRVLLAPLPLQQPDRLVWIATWNAERGQDSKSRASTSTPGSRRTEIFESVEAFWDRAYTVTGTVPAGGTGRLAVHAGTVRDARHASGDGPHVHREDGEAGRDDLVVLSDGLWRRRFDARPDVVGTQSSSMGGLHDRRRDAADFHPSLPDRAAVDAGGAVDNGARRSQAAVLPGRRPTPRGRDPRTGRSGATLNRRAPGQGAPGHAPGVLRVGPSAARFYVGDARPLLWVLQGTARLLLIAVSNVAGLVLVRETGRQRETAVRLALGASQSISSDSIWPRAWRWPVRCGRADWSSRCGAPSSCRSSSPPDCRTRRCRAASPAGSTRAWSWRRRAPRSRPAYFSVSRRCSGAPTVGGHLHGTSRGATGDRRTRLLAARHRHGTNRAVGPVARRRGPPRAQLRAPAIDRSASTPTTS